MWINDTNFEHQIVQLSNAGNTYEATPSSMVMGTFPELFISKLTNL